MEDEQQASSRQKIYFLGAGVVVLIALGLFLLQLPASTPGVQTPEATEDIVEVEEEVRLGAFYFPEGNFAFDVAQGWKPYIALEDELPPGLGGVENAQFSFKKENTSCTLTYVRAPAGAFTLYDQTSFADRVFTLDNHQIDSSWYLHETHQPENLQFDWEERQPFPHEVRILYYPSSNFTELDNINGAFLLYNKDGGEVRDECDWNVSSMMTSLKKKYHEGTVSGNGILYVSDGGFKEWSDKFLFFVPEGEKTSYKIMPINYSYHPSPVVKDNLIYFKDRNVLKTLNPFTKNIQELEGISYEDKKYISDFFFLGDRLFFLSGANTCGEYMGECNQLLGEYLFERKYTVGFASGLPYQRFLGYHPIEDALYLINSWGDGGCFSYDIGAYSFGAHEMVDVFSFGGCDGDEGLNADVQYFEEIKEKLIYTTSEAEYLNVKNEKLIAPNVWDDFVPFNYLQTIRIQDN